MIDSKADTRATLARDYVPGPGIRRTWPTVARAFGIKRRLTGVSFEAALERMRSRPSLLSTLTPELIQAFGEAEDLYGTQLVGPLGAPLRKDLPAT
jgi:hypothetical protein